MARPNKNDKNLVKRAGKCRRNLMYASAFLTQIGIIGGIGIYAIDNDFLPTTDDSATLTEPFNETTTTPTENFTTAIDDAVQEALSPFDTIDVLYKDTDGTIFYKDWVVPNDVFEADTLTAEITGLPLSYTLAVQSIESSFNARALNGIKACGLAQFVPTTLAEKSYKYGELIGYEGIKDNLVERSVDRRDDQGNPFHSYDYVDTFSQHTLIEACWDPNFNTRLAAIMQIQDIGRIQRNLTDIAPENAPYFPVTELQGYVAHFAGRTAGENLISDMIENEGKTEARNFFSEAARNNETNQNLLYNVKIITSDDGTQEEIIDLKNPRSVAEFFTFLSEEKGLSNTPLPDFTNWEYVKQQIIYNMDYLNIDTTNITKSTALAYSQRPERRPSDLATQMSEAVTPTEQAETTSAAPTTFIRPVHRPHKTSGA